MMPLSQVIPNPCRDNGANIGRRDILRAIEKASRGRWPLSRSMQSSRVLHRHRGRIPTPRKNRINLNPLIALDEGLGYRAVDARIVRELPWTHGPNQAASTAASQRL